MNLIKSNLQVYERKLANTAHDMRTPLNSIIQMASLIEENEEDEQKLLWTKIVRNSSKHLLCLVNDNLDYH